MENVPQPRSLERLITDPMDTKKALDGSKRAQRRSKRYGDPGDRFTLAGHPFELTAVYTQQFRDISDEDAQKEGYETLSAYHRHLSEMHSNAHFGPDLTFWVHEFRAL
ncbi:hypothetical protein [Ferroacidibacillus organovorans]|uniref:ASCH domain-containing protein n=1 Tax=Ferroacidibacillus organovorans TaxID=1765683 RepID=A0A853KBA7_9BACL|nr:hypothetical protein [Ferroacidibacillus organovorans]KYP81060.1 hypothetical protein AYJ22_09010 [Ferroacidibacillus organovorans]OAG93688.1 hypothetical protein AYW79_09270 [Ferroacidibacillus organovorans]